MALKRKLPELDKKAWEALLAFLDPQGDERSRGEKYEEIRRKLIRIFACRGRWNPEELADQAMDRVARKCGEIASSYVGDPALYCYGVARFIFKESLKKRSAPLPMPEPDPWQEKEAMHACLERCMKKLPRRRKRLILDYYSGAKAAKIGNRSNLAELLGMSVNALRIEAYRIRKTLQSCVFECLKRGTVG